MQQTKKAHIQKQQRSKCENNCFDNSRRNVKMAALQRIQRDMNQISSHQSSDKPSGPTQQQLALDIFSSLDLVDTNITESGVDFHLKKSSILVDVSDVGLLARRVLNGTYFLAQSDPDAETHVYELRYFKWLINYSNSNNNTHLKRVIREAQKSAVQVNVLDSSNPDNDTWMSVPMLGAAAIKGGKIMFKIPTELRSQLRDPKKHAFLSMRILAGFSSIYALELYERLSVFKDEGRTPWWSIDDFRSLIKVDGLKSANDFRYFRRDILQPAVDQINLVSDIDVVPELKRTGRSFSHISFTIKPAQGSHLLSSISESKALYDILVEEFGLSNAELDEISSNRDEWPDARIRDAVAFVQHRCQTSTVQYPGKYLMKAIRDGYRVGSIEKAEKEKKLESSNRSKKLREEKPATPVEMPAGAALEEAWRNFMMSTQSKLFKDLPASFDLATPRQRKGFEGFLASQR